MKSKPKSAKKCCVYLRPSDERIIVKLQKIRSCNPIGTQLLAHGQMGRSEVIRYALHTVFSLLKAGADLPSIG